MTRDERAKLAAPTVPPETCPTVDRLSTRLDAIDGDLELFREGLLEGKRKTCERDDVVDMLLEAESNLAGARLIAEELRNANDQLRESGRYWRGVAKGRAEELEALIAAVEAVRHRQPGEVQVLLDRLRDAA
jgi:hypothetical protein